MDWIRSILIAVAVAMVFRWAVGEPFRIPSESMVPTLQIGDRIWVNKWVYGWRFPFDGFRIPFTRTTLWYARDRIWEGAAPQRWDVVVFKSNETEAEHDTLVKRIVALPGEHVSIHDAQVYVNGKPLELPPDMPRVMYTSPPPAFTDMKYGLLSDAEHAVVPRESYFVLGDNSPYSRDGRAFGWLPKENILGRVACVWWPLGRASDFTGFTDSTLWRLAVGSLIVIVVFRMFVGNVERFVDPGVARAPLWAFVSFANLGLRLPFTNRWLLRFGRPRRHEWVALEYQPVGGPAMVALGQVVAMPGDDVAWGEEVLVNGQRTGLPGLAQYEERYPAATRVVQGQYLVMVYDERRGRRLMHVDARSIRGTVHPIRPRGPLPATVGL